MQEKGFTLIELLVVVLIIGILAAIAWPNYQVAVGKARVARALPFMRDVYEAKRMWFLANPDGSLEVDNFDTLDISFPYTMSGARQVENQPGRRVIIVKDTPVGVLQSENKTPSIYVTIDPGKPCSVVIDMTSQSGKTVCYGSREGSCGDKICRTLGPRIGTNVAGTAPTYEIKMFGNIKG